MIVVLMGVSGCGKTVVGQALAVALGWRFVDGDDFHPPENVAKMAAGTPLTDEDRWPWLDRISREMGEVQARGGNAVLACSALKQAYRDRLAACAKGEGDVRFVHLKGDAATIAARLSARRHRYMPAALLASQFAALEEPVGSIVVDIVGSVDDEVASIRRQLGIGKGAA